MGWSKEFAKSKLVKIAFFEGAGLELAGLKKVYLAGAGWPKYLPKMG
jgi:hypothetical protein